MRNKILQELIDKTPQEIKDNVDKYSEMLVLSNLALDFAEEIFVKLPL